MTGCISCGERMNGQPFADYLKWYNDLDVTPIISAIDNMNNFYRERKIDFIHQVISLPGIAMRVFFDSVTDLKAEFHLFKLFKDNIIGGPSIIFNRHHEAARLSSETIPTNLVNRL